MREVKKEELIDFMDNFSTKRQSFELCRVRCEQKWMDSRRKLNDSCKQMETCRVRRVVRINLCQEIFYEFAANKPYFPYCFKREGEIEASRKCFDRI